MNGAGRRATANSGPDNRRMRPRQDVAHRSAGFSLIELMIAVAVVLILSAMVWPSLQEAVQKSRRADGIAALTKIMQAQESWRANHPAYQSVLADLTGATATTSPDGHYSLSLSKDSATATGYTAQAAVRSGSPQAGDSRCQVLEVNVSGGRITYSSSGSGGANGAPDPCWVR